MPLLLYCVVTLLCCFFSFSWTGRGGTKYIHVSCVWANVPCSLLWTVLFASFSSYVWSFRDQRKSRQKIGKEMNRALRSIEEKQKNVSNNERDFGGATWCSLFLFKLFCSWCQFVLHSRKVGRVGDFFPYYFRERVYAMVSFDLGEIEWTRKRGSSCCILILSGLLLRPFPLFILCLTLPISPFWAELAHCTWWWCCFHVKSPNFLREQ